MLGSSRFHVGRHDFLSDIPTYVDRSVLAANGSLLPPPAFASFGTYPFCGAFVTPYGKLRTCHEAFVLFQRLRDGPL